MRQVSSTEVLDRCRRTPDNLRRNLNVPGAARANDRVRCRHVGRISNGSNEFGHQEEADDFFRMYPAASDEDVFNGFARFDTDYAFGYPAHRFASNAPRSGQKVWHYYFTYAGRTEAYDKLGAFHGIEGRFLTGWFPAKWGEITAEDRRMIDLMTGYWVQFAKAGDPNRAGLPPWPNYDTKTDQAQEIGHEVKRRPAPHGDRFPVFERSLNRRLALLGKDRAGAAQSK